MKYFKKNIVWLLVTVLLVCSVSTQTVLADEIKGLYSVNIDEDSLNKGDEFLVNVKTDRKIEDFRSAQFNLNYDDTKVELVEVTKKYQHISGSGADLIRVVSYYNANYQQTGAKVIWLMNTGHKNFTINADEVFLTVKFRAKSIGDAKFNLDNTELVVGETSEKVDLDKSIDDKVSINEKITGNQDFVVTKPVKNADVDFKTAVTGAGIGGKYNLELVGGKAVNWYEKGDDGKWNLYTAAKFKGGKVYKAVFKIRYADFYLYDDNIQVKVNGEDATFTKVDNENAFEVSYEFGSTDAAVIQSININSADSIDVPKNSDIGTNKYNSIDLKVNVLFDDGTTSLSDASFSVVGALPKGVSLEGSTLKVSNETTAPNVTVKAVKDGKQATKSIAINREASKVSVVKILKGGSEISGDNVLIPVLQDDVEVEYDFVIYDQFGIAMNGEKATFSLVGNVSGVSISGKKLKVLKTTPNNSSIKLVVTSDSDAKVNKQITINFALKYILKNPVLTIDDYSKVYDAKAVKIEDLTKSAKVAGKDVVGSWAFVLVAPTNVSETGKHKIRFTPTDRTKYAVVDKDVSITITKADVVGTVKYTSINQSGKTLADALLTLVGSSISVAGTVSWVDDKGAILPPTTKVVANKSYKWIFNPTDSANYNNLQGEVVLYKYTPSSGGGSSSGGSSVVIGDKEVPKAPKEDEQEQVYDYGIVQGRVAKKSDVVNLEVSEDKKEEFKKELKEKAEKKEPINIDVSDNTMVSGIVLPSVILDDIEESGFNENLNLVLPEGRLEIDFKQLKQLSTKDDVKVEIHRTNNNLLNKLQRKSLGKNLSNKIVELVVYDGNKKLKSLGFTKAKLTIDYKLGKDEKKENIVIWSLKEDGTLQQEKFTYNEKLQKIEFSPNKLSKFVVASFPFDDVMSDYWAYSNIATSYNQNILIGISETKFAPKMPVSRAMLAAIMYRIAKGEEADAYSQFKDVNSSSWYAKYVVWARKNNIIKGYDGVYFGPDDNITREQMVTVIYRYLKKSTNLSDTKLSKYADAKDVSGYAIEPMKWALEQGIIKGVSEKRLSPKTNVTRAQMATFIKRLLYLVD